MENDYNDLLFVLVGWLIGQVKDIFLWVKERFKKKYELKDYKSEFRKRLVQSKNEAKKIQVIIDILRERLDAKNITVSLYHNGTKDYRGIGLKFWSIIYESPRSHLLDSIIDDMQVKPLSPFYPLIEELSINEMLVFKTGEPIDHSIVASTMSILSLKELYMIGIKEGSEVLGTINILMDSDSPLPIEETRAAILSGVIEIQSILNTSEFTYIRDNLPE